MKSDDAEHLLLQFTQARDAVSQAMERFTAASQKLAQAINGNPETTDMMRDQLRKMRGSVRRMVGILCDQTGLDFHQMWVLVYHEHHKRTKFHAVAEANGTGSLLDAVEKAGQLPALRETIKAMLQSDEFGPRVVPAQQ